jgi:hypothetical protein
LGQRKSIPETRSVGTAAAVGRQHIFRFDTFGDEQHRRTFTTEALPISVPSERYVAALQLNLTADQRTDLVECLTSL